MQAFEYANPTSVKEAVGMLGATWADAAVLAGGTDLLSLMKDYVMSPKRVVNIKNIKELQGISPAGGGLRIGAAVTMDELVNYATLRTNYPSLHAAAAGIASPQIRNMGTVGGDICQRPRCWYFRQGHGLLAMPGGKSLVTNGENKYHAIFGEGPGKFVSASSLGPALVALGAKIKIASASGEKEVDAAKFFLDPKSDSEREIALAPNEIVTAVILPAARNTRNATYEVRHKDALDWPLATASVALTMDGNKVKSAQVVLGHVATTPWNAAEAGKMLAGKSIDADVAAKAADAALASAKPLSQNIYKVHLAKVAVKRALLAAAGIKA